MGLFSKKDSEGAPPDVGSEEASDESGGIGSGGADEGAAGGVMPAIKGGGDNLPIVAPGSGTVNNFEVEKLEARVDSVVDWIKQFYERFSYVSESIGEIRAMNLENEKKISTAMRDAEKVIDVVKEIKPEELNVNYQKADMKMATLAEKIEANTQFMNEIMTEMNDLRRKSEVFIGTEGIMNLNEDTKKELIGIQKLASATKMQADKAQEIFMELRKGFAESQKVSAVMTNLDESYSGLKGSIEGLKVDYSKVVSRSDYEDFKKTYDTKLLALRNNVSEVDKLKEVISEMQSLVETSLTVSRRNEEDITKIGVKVGVEDVKGVSDYENQIVELVEIVDKLSSQVAELRKDKGLKPSKIDTPKKGETKVSDKKIANILEEKKEGGDVVSKGALPAQTVSAEVDEVGKNKFEEKPKILKPSESEDVVKKLEAIKVAEVPKLKEGEFLGKKNHLLTSIEQSEERARAKTKPLDEKLAETNEKMSADRPSVNPVNNGADSEKLEEVLEEAAKDQILHLPKIKSKRALEKTIFHHEEEKKKKLAKKKKPEKKKKKKKKEKSKKSVEKRKAKASDKNKLAKKKTPNKKPLKKSKKVSKTKSKK